MRPIPKLKAGAAGATTTSLPFPTGRKRLSRKTSHMTGEPRPKKKKNNSTGARQLIPGQPMVMTGITFPRKNMVKIFSQPLRLTNQLKATMKSSQRLMTLMLI